MTGARPTARVSIAQKRMWRLRLTRESARYAVIAASMFGLIASARFAIAPPRGTTAAPSAPASATDLAAEGFAVRFTRGYLTWKGDEPALSGSSLESFGGTELEPDLGLEIPPTGEQRVLWAEVVQSREPEAGSHVYTVAAGTSTDGVRYLTVPVRRTASGRLSLSGYPAFVGAPASEPASLPSGLRDVSEPALELVVRRALGNYLADAQGELAADLSAGARVAPPSVPMRLLASGRQEWVPGGGAVTVAVQARDGLGVRYTLSYELDVTRVRGRWEISAIQADPDA